MSAEVNMEHVSSIDFMDAQAREPENIGGGVMVAYRNRVFGLTPAGRLIEVLGVIFGKVVKMKGVDTVMAMSITLPKGLTLRAEDGSNYLVGGDTMYVPGDRGSGEWSKPSTKLALRVKHYVMRGEKAFDRMKREVEAFENMERMERNGSREPIPESVRMFVWQRDKGRCVTCGSNQGLEFDHIIPVIKGGSSTERNVQLLCTAHNREKSDSI